MDERLIQIKRLKKAYREQRRRAVWFWDFMWYFLLALLLVAVCCLCYVVFYRSVPVRLIDIYVWTPIKYMIGIRRDLLSVGLFVLKYGKWMIGGFGALLVLTGIFRFRAVAQTKKLDSYLDYKTLKNTIKTEKQEARQ